MANRSLSASYSISFDTVFVWLIYLMSFMSIVAAVLFLQANTAEIWGTYVLYFRFAVVLLAAVYILFCYLQKMTLRPLIISVYLYLLYVIIVSFMFFRPEPLRVVTGTFTWPLTFLAFYIYGEKKEFTPVFRGTVKVTFLILLVLLFRTLQLQGLEGTNTGPVYYSIAYLPLLYMMSNRTEKLVYSVAVSAIVLFSTKRAGVIALVIGFLSYYICTTFQKSLLRQRIRSVIGMVIVAAVIVLSVYYLLNKYNDVIISRFLSLPEDQGSGRLEIWKTVLEYFRNSSVIQKYLGHGFYAVMFLIQPFDDKIYAHNSYLEFLYDMGLIGCVWLIIMVIAMVMFLVQLLREKNELVAVCAFAMCMVFVFSLVSYFFEEPSTILMIAVFWGTVQGKYYKMKKEKIKEIYPAKT